MAVNCLRLLANAALRRLLVRPTAIHVPKRAFALPFLLEYMQRGIDAVVMDEDVHRRKAFSRLPRSSLRKAEKGAAQSGFPSVAPGLTRLGLS